MSIARKCKIDDCTRQGKLGKDGKRYMVKGLCLTHYTRQSRNISLTSKTSFDSRPALIEDGVAKIPIGLNAKDGYTIVDLDDSWVDKYKWSLSKGYAVGYIDGKYIRLHRLLVDVDDTEQVDHINQNRLDNRKRNLRPVTNQQNAFNKVCTSRSGYKGVTKNSSNKNSWSARLMHNRKGIYLGSFRTPEMAAIAYNTKAIELYGEYANLNKVREN